MPIPIEAPYGTWNSPITAEMTASAEKINRGSDLIVEGNDVYWTESLPSEKGRTVIVKQNASGQTTIITPPGFDVRTKVHEYGGRSFTVLNGVIYFINRTDQKLYIQAENETPRLVTKEDIRLAEPTALSDGVIAVAEKNENNHVDNFLAYIDTKTGKITPLHQGHDFYAYPTLNQNKTKLAWITWDHPNMPWDKTQLWTADFHNNQLTNVTLLNDNHNESLIQPRWSPSGQLYFITDRSGWWNLHNLKGPVYPQKADFGKPLWMLGTYSWDFTGNQDEIVATYTQNGKSELVLIQPATKEAVQINLPYTDFSQPTVSNGNIYLFLASPTTPRRLAKININNNSLLLLDQPEKLNLDTGYISLPVAITYPTTDGHQAHAYYYKPQNPQYTGPKGKLPPLIVMSHGGPTAAADTVLSLRIQYWTSRGFAVLDVNYRGSTGFGRAYRDLLKGKWGIYDVEDCIAGARYLIDKNLVDPKKIFIRGGSAGGFTTLVALTKTDLFAAGASYYGVSDLELLLKDTHKFEAEYLDSLIGSYSTQKELYTERSPINHTSEIHTPVIFFQGGMDKVVPVNQAEVMYNALKKRGIRTEMIIYPEEEHGFRQTPNVKDSLERERQFYLNS